MPRYGISSAQILRVILIVSFALLLYNLIYTDKPVTNKKGSFRRPKLSKLPKQNTAMATNYLKGMAARRSYRQIVRETTISESRIQQIVTEAIRYTPSAFNMQTGRVMILYKGEHDKLWDLGAAATKADIGEAGYDKLREKFVGYRRAYGTILFFEDQEAMKPHIAKNPTFPFAQWSEHGTGMLQINVWTALELGGLGCSLQHYDRMAGFEESIKREWNISAQWALKAQMPFGRPTASPGEKEIQPVQGKRLVVFGGDQDVSVNERL